MLSSEAMRNLPRPATALVAVVLSLFATLALSADGQAAKFDPRDLNGAWTRYPELTSRVDPSVEPPPPDIPPPPLKPQYVADYQEHQKRIADANARGEPLATHYTHCIPDGMPAMMMAMFPMEVIQSPGRVTIVQEAYNQIRRIYMDEQQIAIEDAEPRFWGHSVGRWEGDTLLIDTVGIKEYVRFRDVPHSNQMRITERIRRISAEFMQDQVTVTDPVYLTGPWTWTWKYRAAPGYKLYEYVCEDNREYEDETGAARLRIRPREEAGKTKKE